MSPGSGSRLPRGARTLLHPASRHPVPSGRQQLPSGWCPPLPPVLPGDALVRAWWGSLCGRDPGALGNGVGTCRWAEVWAVSGEGRWQLGAGMEYVQGRRVQAAQHWLSSALGRSSVRPTTSVMEVPLPQVHVPQPFVSVCLGRTEATHTVSLARWQTRDSAAAPAVPLAVQYQPSPHLCPSVCRPSQCGRVFSSPTLPHSLG